SGNLGTDAHLGTYWTRGPARVLALCVAGWNGDLYPPGTAGIGHGREDDGRGRSGSSWLPGLGAQRGRFGSCGSPPSAKALRATSKPSLENRVTGAIGSPAGGSHWSSRRTSAPSTIRPRGVNFYRNGHYYQHI